MSETRPEYYTCDDLDRQVDINGNKPIFNMILVNRGAGKTTFFQKTALEMGREGKANVYLFRIRDEIGAMESMFGDTIDMYKDEIGIVNVTTKRVVGDFIKCLYVTYRIDEDEIEYPVVYGVSIADRNKIKKYSGVFANVERIVFDEFVIEESAKGRSEYLPGEITMLQSVLITISRGGGKQSREVPVYLVANSVYLLNPYFVYFGIHKRLRLNTKYIRGNRWIAEFKINRSAQQALTNNGISEVFGQSRYMGMAIRNEFMISDEVFVERMSGNAQYLYTIIHDGTAYGVRLYADQGIVYISRNADPNCSYLFTFASRDHNANVMRMGRQGYIYDYLLNAYNIGAMRFKDLTCKSVILDILSIRLVGD